jgi:hypothetical protein
MRLSGGEKFEAAIRDIASKLAGGASTLRVGFLEGATYPARPKAALRKAYAKKKTAGAIEGSPGTINVASVAFFQEFGTGTIPPRPFFRTMIREKNAEWGPAFATQLRLTDYDVPRSMEILGAGIAGQLRESIIETNSPPWAASTVARKGFSKPLIDTSHMINSIDHAVVER